MNGRRTKASLAGAVVMTLALALSAFSQPPQQGQGGGFPASPGGGGNAGPGADAGQGQGGRQGGRTMGGFGGGGFGMGGFGGGGNLDMRAFFEISQAAQTIQNYWLELSFDPKIENAKLLALRPAFIKACQARDQATSDIASAASAVKSASDDLDKDLKKVLSEDQYKKIKESSNPFGGMRPGGMGTRGMGGAGGGIEGPDAAPGKPATGAPAAGF
ncbi:MAG: hypothetical protein NTX50_03350 [Candidatus Sumerlaeota bacterium]|nr:hypothetical protein [Candidatus Sumerlaeota bacterium]